MSQNDKGDWRGKQDGRSWRGKDRGGGKQKRREERRGRKGVTIVLRSLNCRELDSTGPVVILLAVTCTRA